MYSVAARSLNRHFVAAPAFFLCLIQVGSAQLVTTPHSLTGYARDTDRALPRHMTAAGSANVGPADVDPVGGVLSGVLPEASATLTSGDPTPPHSLAMQEDFRELPVETDEEPPPDTAGVT